MDLGHRALDKKGFPGILKIIYQIKYPYSLIIPLAIGALGLYSSIYLFGEEWDIGGFSTRVLPFVAGLVEQSGLVESSVFLSGLVVVGTVLFGVSSYFFVLYLTGRHLPAVLTALLLFVSPGIVSSDVPTRVNWVLTGSDGAHGLALGLVPFAFTSFVKFLRTGNKKTLVMLGLLLVLISLISFFTQFMVLLFFVILTASEVLISQSMTKMTRLGIVSLGYLGIIVLVYNFSLIRIFFSESGLDVLDTVGNMIPISFFLVPVVGTIAFLIFDRRPPLQPLFISLVTMIVFFVLKTVGNSFGTSLGVSGERYEGELAFGVSFFIGIIVMWIFDGFRAGSLLKRTPQFIHQKETIAVSFVALILLVLGVSLLMPKSAG